MAEQLVLERLKKLVAKGYVVRWQESEEDTLRLEHPYAPDLTLFSDGRIWVLTASPDDWIASDNETDQRRFQSFVSPEDWIAADNNAGHRRFKSFLARVPQPTILQNLKAMTIEDIGIRITVWTFVMIVALLVGLLVTWLWRVIEK
jgi:hypothetical protein